MRCGIALSSTLMLPQPIQRLVSALRKLPGMGPKSAERLAFHFLKQPKALIEELVESLQQLKEKAMLCERCCSVSQQRICDLCQNPNRDQRQICVVEEAMDVFALEYTGAYKGLYHVLHGALSPLDQVGPEKLTIDRLMKRVEQESVQELILATNPTVTGEATAMYLSRLVKPRGIRVTHLAQGLPMGGHLEFADPDTLRKAMTGRRE